MFQPNKPQWVTIVVTFVFAATAESSQGAVFVVVAGALIAWWLEARRQRRNELQQRTEAGAETEDWDLSRLLATYDGAEAGDRDLLSRLLATYDIDTDVPKADLNSLRKAAEQGHAAAQRYLGFVYSDGRGVPQDFVEAVRWSRLAAEQGDATAQFNLGLAYSTGQGVQQDYVESHKWGNLAASRATGDRQKPFTEARDALAKLMTPAQVAEAQKLAREWQAVFDARQE